MATVDPAQANQPVIKGPFGTVTTVDHWHSVAGFQSVPSDATVLTRNLLHFEKVPGLRDENWLD